MVLGLVGPFESIDGLELGMETSEKTSDRGVPEVTLASVSERTGFHVDPLRCNGAPHSSLKSSVT